uniref:Secreted protein n=1 Tax=Oryzias latipes TaxID=8090 RepID=A0A3B3HN52_ORYLA
MSPGFIIKPAGFLHIVRVTLSFWALNPGAFASSCMIKVREGILFQDKPVSSMLKTCSGLYPPSSMMALNVLFAYSSAPAGSAEAASPCRETS